MALPTSKLPPAMTRIAPVNAEAKDTSTAKFELQDLLGNLELLYVKAKNFHWNVQGPNFIGLHETFDGIQDVALDWADRIAERMRALDIRVDARSCRFLGDAWFPEPSEEPMMQYEMIRDMVLTLKCIVAYLTKAIAAHTFDATTENQLQDLAYQLDKQNYFIKSNLSTPLV